jgi:hypothetical protein
MLGAAAAAIDMLASSVTLHRTAAGTWAENGVYTPGTTTATTIAAVVQAPKREDLEQSPEGESTEGMVTIYTRADLRTADESIGATADEITVASGERYKVTSISARRDGGFTRASARRIHDRGRSL